MKRFLTFFKIEGMLSLRCPDGVLFGLIMPVGVLLLIVAVAKDTLVSGSQYTYLQGAFASLITIGICVTAFMGLPLAICDYRDKKILKHFFVTPVSPILLLGVQVLICVCIGLLSSILIALFSIFVFGYQMQGNVFLFIGAYLLVLFSMYSIGMVIASLCKSVKIANMVTSFVYFPMLFLSGASIPFELFPKVLQQIANILPLTHGIKLLKSISMDMPMESMGISILVLVSFGVAGCVISVVKFKWE